MPTLMLQTRPSGLDLAGHASEGPTAAGLMVAHATTETAWNLVGEAVLPVFALPLFGQRIGFITLAFLHGKDPVAIGPIIALSPLELRLQSGLQISGSGNTQQQHGPPNKPSGSLPTGSSTDN